MGLLSVPVMMKSAVQGPRAPSMTGTDLGSGLWARAAVTNSRMGRRFIGCDYKTFTTEGTEGHRGFLGYLWLGPLAITSRDGRGGCRSLALGVVGITGTGYQRSLPVYESDPYNF